MFNNLQNMFGGGMMGQPMQQPMMGYTAPQQNQFNGFGMSNGFGYPGAGMVQAPMAPMGNPAMAAGYTPANPGFQYNPGAAQAPVAPTTSPVPAAPAPQGDTTVTQAVNA